MRADAIRPQRDRRNSCSWTGLYRPDKAVPEGRPAQRSFQVVACSVMAQDAGEQRRRDGQADGGPQPGTVTPSWAAGRGSDQA